MFWNAYQHPRFKGWDSDRATPGDIQPNEPQFLYTSIRHIAGDKRYLDKTPKNILKLAYLAELFPDAIFIFIKRDGRATVNSLIEGWEVRQTPSFKLPHRLTLADYRGRYWSFVLPPGWRDWATTSIAEVAAFQYSACYDWGLRDRETIDREHFVDVAFEEFLQDPIAEATRILGALGLAPTEPVLEMASRLNDYPVMSNSPPRPDKWRDREDRINQVMPIIAPTMKRLGYDAGL